MPFWIHGNAACAALPIPSSAECNIGSMPLTMLDRSGTVSYTHLDVYKRQGLVRHSKQRRQLNLKIAVHFRGRDLHSACILHKKQECFGIVVQQMCIRDRFDSGTVLSTPALPAEKSGDLPPWKAGA